MLQGKAETGSKPSPSQEHYLRAIFEVLGPEGDARVSDVAALLEVSKPTISAALKTLASHGFAEHRRYGRVTLTPLGRLRAQQVFNRYAVVRYFLRHLLKLDVETVSGDACQMEHAISGETVDRMTDLARFFMDDPEAQRLLSRFDTFRRVCAEDEDECPVCVFECEVNLAKEPL